MPTDYTYNVPVTYTPETNNTRITKKVVTFKNCTWGLDEGCTGWNFTKCSNDDTYCQPFVAGDKLYMQYLIPATWGSVAAFEMIDSNGENISYGSSVTTQVGKDPDGLRYINIIIDTALLPEGVTCFHVKLTMWDCKALIIPSQGYLACLASQIFLGKTLAEAVVHCADILCGVENQKVIYSEPYCAVRCEEPTSVIEGEYSKYDCESFYYGPLANVSTGAAIVNLYVLKFRVRGFLELDNYETTVTEVNGKETKITQTKKYTFYNEKIPPYVAAQIARAAGSKQFILDDVEYNRPANIAKEFDQGLSWIPKLSLTKKCDDFDLTCE